MGSLPQPYYEHAGVTIYHGDCAEVLPALDIQPHLILTSPPYGTMRDYGGHGFDFDRVADTLVACMPAGGVLVWVVRDETVEGSESGESFRQALGFKGRGLLLHDTMIYVRRGSGGLTYTARHSGEFEYMFVLSRGSPATVNVMIDRVSKTPGKKYGGALIHRNRDGVPTSRRGRVTPPVVPRTNVWTYYNGRGAHESALPHEHPATFPVKLAQDHIRTWTNPGDLVLDPMAGSGTTLRAAVDLGRQAVGIEIHEPYLDLIRRRMGQQVLAL